MSAVTSFAANTSTEELIEALLPDIVQAVRAACSHYGVDQVECKDFYHEIVLLLIANDYHNLCSFRSESSRQTWLTAIALHYVSRHITHRKRELSLTELPEALFMRNPRQEQEVIAFERECRLAEAIGRLTARERQLFELLCRDDLTSMDIATELCIKAASVRRRKHALIKKLRGAVG